MSRHVIPRLLDTLPEMKSVTPFDWCSVNVYMSPSLTPCILIVLLIGIPITAVTKFISDR